MLLSALTLADGGTHSPAAFLFLGLVVLLWPSLRAKGLVERVVPVKDSVLLRSRLLPYRWYAVAEVKHEAPDQTRAIAALDGTLLVFAGKAPAALLVLCVNAIGYRQAEEMMVEDLRRSEGALSRMGGHLLPLDSGDAAGRLSLSLKRLGAVANYLDAVASTSFDVLVLRAEGGLVVSHREFRAIEAGRPAIPRPDLSVLRPPLLAEVVEKIGEGHGWPGPDEYSSFLAAMDATRSEPLAERFRAAGEIDGRMAVETPNGVGVKLTRAQLRAVARIYA